jgi:hypothetical protein
VKLRIVGTLLFSAAWVACDDKEAPSAPVEAEGKGPASAEAKAVGTPAPKPEPVADAKAAEDAEPKPAREWLVWFREGEGWTTRWVGDRPDRGDTTETVAERKALVHGTYDSAFHIVRRDADVDVRTCACMSGDFGSKDECERTGKVTRPGLAAIDLRSGEEKALVLADAGSVFGEVYGMSLQVTGGVQGRLVVRTEDAGYYCGAHQSIDAGDRMLVLGGEAREWPTIELPEAVKTAAATGEMFDLYAGCEGGTTLDAFVRDTMRWSGLAIALEAGAPRPTWTFTADVYYACSPDYLATGHTTTDLLPEAAALGLAPPLPAGLSRALSDIGTKPAVGWAELKLTADERADVLAKFQALEETPWPPANSEVRPHSAEAGPADAGAARTKLAEAREHTRAKDYAAAIAAFDAAILADPKMARAWAGRGYAKLLAGDLSGAKKDSERALELDETEGFQASVHYNLGLVAQKQGKTSAAKAAFARSLALRAHDEVQRAHDAL